MRDDDSYVEGIAENVLVVLTRKRFFEMLDDEMCPIDPAGQGAICRGSYDLASSVLAQLGFSSEDSADVLQVLAARGGHCDCEILFNVAETSRLKAAYWTE